MAASQGKACGILMWKLRRKIGAAIVRANAMLLMDRVAHMGGDAARPLFRPVSGANHIAPTRLADGKAPLARPTSFSSV